MKLVAETLEGRFVRLEPFEPRLKEEVRAAIDCDPETWAIMPINPMGEGFEVYWSIACGASLNERIAYAIRCHTDGLVVGMSSYYTRWRPRVELKSELRFCGLMYEAAQLILKPST